MLGNGTLEGIYGTATHELGHSWFQHILANESKHPWMDEGFTSIFLILQKMNFSDKSSPFAGNYRGYYSLVNSVKNSRKQHMVIVMKKTDLYFVLHKRKFVLIAVELRNGADK
jgi:hypothetical protein